MNLWRIFVWQKAGPHCIRHLQALLMQWIGLCRLKTVVILGLCTHIVSYWCGVSFPNQGTRVIYITEIKPFQSWFQFWGQSSSALHHFLFHRSVCSLIKSLCHPSLQLKEKVFSWKEANGYNSDQETNWKSNNTNSWNIVLFISTIISLGYSDRINKKKHGCRKDY